MNIFEISGVILGVVSLLLMVRQSLWTWPIGIVSSLAFAVLFFQSKLYADFVLQVIFALTGGIGWYFWASREQHNHHLQVSRLAMWQIIMLVIAMILSVSLSGTLLARYTDAHVPYWDSAASGMSILAQILLTRKKYESWFVWMVVDILSCGIYIHKALYLTAGLDVIFFVISAGGAYIWFREMRRGKSVPTDAILPQASPAK
jgi:nicotinamide mononucleotide transporter